MARGAAEDQPGVVHRRRAVGCEGQLEQTRGQAVVEHREHPAEHRRVEAGVEKVEKQLGNVAGRRGELVCVARRLQRAAQRERAARFEAHQVAGRYHADHAALLVEHRQVVHALGQHGDAGFRGEGVGSDGVDR